MKVNLFEGFKRFNQFVIVIIFIFGIVGVFDQSSLYASAKSAAITSAVIVGYIIFCKFVKYIVEGFIGE